MDKRKVARAEFIGFLFIVITGSLLHFVFDWSYGKSWVALFAAVNESTWEHLKLAFFPAALFSIIEYPFLKDKIKNFLLAKTVSFYAMPVVIIALFYGYLFLFKEDSLFWDIFIFILAVAIGQLLSYRILTTEKAFKKYKTISIIMLLIISISFITLTYFAPRNFLFKDPVTGGFGIIK